MLGGAKALGAAPSLTAGEEDEGWALGGWLRVVSGVYTAPLLVWSPHFHEAPEGGLSPAVSSVLLLRPGSP